jgi:hypothetical protein
MRLKFFDNITSVLVFLFSLFASITFWVFIIKGDVFDHWYPLVGMLVASHGALIGIIVYEWQKFKRFKKENEDKFG